MSPLDEIMDRFGYQLGIGTKEYLLNQQTSKNNGTRESYPPGKVISTPQESPFSAKGLSTPVSSSVPRYLQNGVGCGAPSVKNLTCYYWYTNGKCKWDDSTCLYAHRYTGNVADAPQQLEPGMPKVAGKNALDATPKYTKWRMPIKYSLASEGQPLAVSTTSNGHDDSQDDKDHIEYLEGVVREQRRVIVGQTSSIKKAHATLGITALSLTDEGLVLINLARALIKGEPLDATRMESFLSMTQNVSKAAKDVQTVAKELKIRKDAVGKKMKVLNIE